MKKIVLIVFLILPVMIFLKIGSISFRSGDCVKRTKQEVTLKFNNDTTQTTVTANWADFIIKKTGTNVQSIPKPGTRYIATSDTNLTSVLQNCLDQLVNGGIIHINKGTYDFMDSINIPYNYITIEGDGMYKTVLKLRPWFDYSNDGISHNKGMFWLRNSDHITIKNIQLDGNADNQHYQWDSSNKTSKIQGIMGSWWTKGRSNWDEPDYFYMKNCYIHDFTQYGIYLNMSRYSTIEDCLFRDNRENNFNMSDSCFHLTISHCISEGAGSVGIAITGYDNEVRDCIQRPSKNWCPNWGLEFIRTAYRCKLINNTVIGAAVGFGGGKEMKAGFGASGSSAGLKNCLITGNQFISITGSNSKGITLQDDTMSVISNNYITDVTGYGIQILGGMKTCITNNYIRSANGKTAGIYLGPNDENTIHSKNCYVAGNYVEIYGYGIAITGYASDNVVMDNVFNSLNYGDYHITSGVKGTIWENNYSQRSNSVIFLNQVSLSKYKIFNWFY